jgi:transglutaminase-like putative cysteine protease
MFEFFFNLCNRRYRKPLPPVSSIEDIQKVLEQIAYTGDGLVDNEQDPEVTWGKKTGDCEDFAALAIALLKSIGIEAKMLKVYCKDKRLSHAVAIFMWQGKYNYFSNSNLVETGYTTIKEVAFRVRPESQVKLWGVV